MARVSTYLNFPGTTEKAFNFYRSVFGGQFTGGIHRFGEAPPAPGQPPLSEADKKLVMHIELPILAGHALMGTDAPQSMGFIDVDSAIGVGTTMTLYLPLTEPAAVASAEEIGGTAFRARGETVLVVEDEDALRRLAKSILEELGYTVLTATDGIDAIEVDEDCEGRIDLLLTDVVMPGLDGIGAAQAIVQQRPDIKVVFMSGYPSRGDLSRGDLPGGVPLLEKPFNAYSLARTLREALDGTTGATDTKAAASLAPERYGT